MLYFYNYVLFNSNFYNTYNSWQPRAIIMSLFRQSSLKHICRLVVLVKKFWNKILISQTVRLEAFNKMIHKRYSKNDTQKLLENCLTTVTQKLVHNYSSKNDPQSLLENCLTTVTQKVIHKRYSKIDPQMLIKNWFTNVTQKFTHNCYSKICPQF